MGDTRQASRVHTYDMLDRLAASRLTDTQDWSFYSPGPTSWYAYDP